MRKPTMDHNAASHPPSMASSHASLTGYPTSHSPPPYHSTSDREGRSSRASSRTQSDINSEAGRYNKARRPINDAVTSAITAADANHTAIPAEILSQITSQITANVLEQLKASNIPAPAPVPVSVGAPERSHITADHAESSSSFTGSPPLDRSKVYTPPSPHRLSEQAAQSQTSPTFSNFSMGSTHVPENAAGRRAVSPFGAVHSDESDGKERFSRPEALKRVSTTGDATILEKIWGKMFDEEGQCTERLGQFLRGIAVHIIEDYEPKHSLVITPDKMQKYYQETKLPNEYYPWHVVFDDRTSSISRMFRDVEIQHHLVQDRLDERPDIPGMTPQGFETWMKLALKAQPDLEFERLSRTALHMPISNPDDRTERFPKEISRRLFPQESDASVARKLAKVMRTHCGVKLPARENSSSETDPKQSQTSARPNGTSQSSVNIPQRPIYGDDGTNNTTSQTHRPSVSERPPPPPRVESVADEDDPTSFNAKPIERERKPYVAQPGGGKTYDDTDAVPLTRVSTVAGDHFTPSVAPAKLGRSASVTGAGRNADVKPRAAPISVHQRGAQPVEVPVPESRHHRTHSFRSQDPRVNRNRSPSITRSREPTHRSDHEIKPSSYQSNGSGGDYVPNSYRYANEHRPSFSGDTRASRDDRDRTRPRYQSISHVEHPKHYYVPQSAAEEEYYRNNIPTMSAGAYSGSDAFQYPPNAYRTKG